MFQTAPWLSSMIFLPFAAALVLFSIRGSEEQVAFNARWVAFWASFVTFAISLYLLFNFQPQDNGLQFQEHIAWMRLLQMSYSLGVDGISLPFVVLSTFLTVLAILSSWQSITRYVREYMAMFLILEAFMIGMFCATDLMLFFIFFEAILIPMFFIIGVWGGENRIYATLKFFLYTFLGSVFFLIAILYINTKTQTFNIQDIAAYHFSREAQMWLWAAFFTSFAVKIPMWPLHTWLPDAHVEAPTAGSVILAAILLKAGGYGLLRFALPFFPEATLFFAPLVFILSLIAIIYASCIALVQKDIKKLIAYSSVAHMGFVTMGIFSMTLEGLQGAVFQMLGHGIISGGLFFCIGMLYERFHTRDITLFGGLVYKMPNFSWILMLFVLGSLGLPSTMGFIGEFLVILGTFQVQPAYASLAAIGIVLSAVYGLWFYRKLIFGPPSSLSPSGLYDLKMREMFVITPLALLVLIFGIYPRPLLQLMEKPIASILALAQSKIAVQQLPNDMQISASQEPKKEAYDVSMG